MKISILLPLLSVLSIGTAAAQHFDTSANGKLNGNYFVREVLFTGQDTNQQITGASSAIGTLTFDGNGNYSFTGQGMKSGAAVAALTATGTYKLAANGFFAINSLVANTDVAYGGISSLGPSAFVASATEGTNVDIIVGIPVSTAASAATLKGNYSAGYIDFLNADINQVRQATFNATADGSGNLGNPTVSGKMANTGGAATSQTVAGVAYTLTANGSGTINFGPASSSQLISGAKNLYVSTDGSIVLGGSPGGFDLLVGFQQFTGTATNSSYNGLYYLGGVEELIAGPSQGGTALDSFYGSVNATGTGTALVHNRFQSFAQPVFDYTFSSAYSVNAAGTFTPADIPYSFTLANNGAGFIATGTDTLYSLIVGFAAPKYSGTGVFINPLGVVNAGSFAPITNPVAPNEFVSIFGTGLAASTVKATTLPLQTTLGGVQVTVNGTAAPVLYVSSTQITFLVPSSISPANGVFYATIAVSNGSAQSNQVTVYTSNTSPGVISLAASGIGPVAAQHSNFTTIGATSPAQANESVILYLVGLGAVTPAPADGAAASATTLSNVTAPVGVNIQNETATTSFVGLTPTATGLYQINAAIPAGVSSGISFVDVATADAYTSQASINLQGTGSAFRVAAIPDAPSPAVKKRRAPATTGQAKSTGLRGRAASAE
jgi:uncharacterized protein (TIGR03437 family)